jgi:hypothetical protein
MFYYQSQTESFDHPIHSKQQVKIFAPFPLSFHAFREMPRLTARQKALRGLRLKIDTRRQAAVLRYLLDEEDSSEDDADVEIAAEYARVAASRYFDRPSSYRRREDRWKKLLYDAEFLNSTEFLEHFRMERHTFFRLVDLVKGAAALLSSGYCPFRGSADLHMVVVLKCLGGFGNDSTWSKHAQFLGVGKGTIGDYLHRATSALLNL